jgi:hypothetical protein
VDILNLSNCKNADEVKELVAKRVESIPVLTVKEELRKRYYNVDQVIDMLYASCVSESNGILYGPGGFGKSKVTKDFFKFFGIPVNTIVGYHDMEVEGLLGIPNMKKLMEESEYKTAFDKSVFSKPGVLILEEFLDVRPSTAAALKDILTEGGLRQGDAFTPAMAGQVFICSNKDTEGLSVDNSTSAFYKDRFPCNLFVAWDTYNKQDYDKLFSIVLSGDYETNTSELDVLAGLSSRSSSTLRVVSPRTALSAARLVIKSGIDSLKFVSELDTSMLDEVKYELRQAKALNTLDKILEETLPKIDEIMKSFPKMDLEERTNLQIWLKHIDESINQLLSKNSSDEVLELAKPMKYRLEQSISHISSFLNTPDIKKYDYNKQLGCAEIRKLVDRITI